MKRLQEEPSVDTDYFDGGKSKNKKIKKEHLIKDIPKKDIKLTSLKKNKTNKLYESVSSTNDAGANDIKEGISGSADSESVSPSKPKKFKFKSAKGEKKGVIGTFAAKTLPKTEADKKKLREQQKLLRKSRREKDKGYAIPGEAKKIYEEIRCSKCPPERREELSKELFKFLSGKITSAVRTHDLARMVQWLIKVGPTEVKEAVVREVIEDTINLSNSKYSNHIILTILQECDKSTRKKIFSYLVGNVNKLISNRFSAYVIEEYYSKYAKSKEKAFFRQELYSDLFRAAQNPSLTCLSEVLSQNENLTSAILKSTKAILSKLINKKSSLSTSLVTDVLYDYLQHCEEQDKLDLLEILKSNIQVLLTTKSGNKILMLLLWESTAKVKKAMVKELKSQVLKIAKSDGNIFILSLFDSVDDTVLMKKAILPTLLDNVEDLIKDTHGRRVILYLVAHRDPAYFHPKELEELSKADKSSNVKKDITVKEKELLLPCIETLLVKIKENPQFWFSEASIAVVASAVLKNATGSNVLETYQAIAEFIANNIQEDKFKVIEDPGIHMNLKKLIKKEESGHEITSFSECLTNCLTTDSVKKLLTSNRGCFVLVLLIETNNENIIARLKKLFKKCKILEKLNHQDSKGSQILNKLISNRNLLSE